MRLFSRELHIENARSIVSADPYQAQQMLKRVETESKVRKLPGSTARFFRRTESKVMKEYRARRSP